LNCTMLRQCGVPADRITVLNGAARSTYDEALALAAYLADTPPSRIMIVTSGPHARRAGWICRRILGAKAAEVTVISAPIEEFDPTCWWKSERGLVMVVGECLKLGFYGLRYGYVFHVFAGLVLGWISLKILLRRRTSQVDANHATRQ
jgi:uncharacterized SAM-binding protein YcdF (DUF218 family)